jgi:hypothetical protein
MSRRLALSLDQFGASALEEHAERYSVSPPELASRPLLPLRPWVRSGGAAVPRLPTGAVRKPVLRLTVDLDQDSWQELADEATRQHVSLEVLLEHAVMYFLGDLDSGRVERSMLGDEGA